LADGADGVNVEEEREAMEKGSLEEAWRIRRYGCCYLIAASSVD
jgi:hypothetical protein